MLKWDCGRLDTALQSCCLGGLLVRNQTLGDLDQSTVLLTNCNWKYSEACVKSERSQCFFMKTAHSQRIDPFIFVDFLSLAQFVSKISEYRRAAKKHFGCLWLKGCLLPRTSVHSHRQLMPSANIMSTNETLHRRSFFYVGGEYVPTPGGHVLQNQMYVEKLTPAETTKPYPIIFIHGGAQTGTVRLTSFIQNKY
jgi:hypothetical protein